VNNPGPAHPLPGSAAEWPDEYRALRETAGVLDLSARSRICLVGNDRARFLHGQVTNDVKRLRPGDGCYAAIVTAKGKMESDLNIFNLQDELLLDFEPGLTEKISQRLERFIVADDVQIVDAAPHYGLLSAQGPKADEAVVAMGLIGGDALPRVPYSSLKISNATFGEIYLMNHARLSNSEIGKKNGFDIFVPRQVVDAFKDKLIAAVRSVGGCFCGQQAFETVRIEAGVPRFGIDMDETNIPLECGIESAAISYKKGCYIGQEVINRIHSIGHVNKELRCLRLSKDLSPLPAKGDKLFCNEKEVGYVTSVVRSPALDAVVALGYVRREVNRAGTELILKTAASTHSATIAAAPFV
jgi:folate-binding protein YgfZ